MEITIHKISVAPNITSFTIVKAMMLSTLFLSIYRLLNTVYTFRGLGNNLGPLLAFYFKLMVFEGDYIYLLQYIQHLSLRIIVILLAACRVTWITTGSLPMSIQ